MISSGIDNIEFHYDGTVIYPDNLSTVILSHTSQLQEMFMGRVRIEEQTYLIKKPGETSGLLGINYKITPLRETDITYQQITEKLLGVTLKKDDIRGVIYSTKYNMFRSDRLNDPETRVKCYNFLNDIIGVKTESSDAFSSENGIIYCKLRTLDPEDDYSSIMQQMEILVDEYDPEKHC